MGIETTFDGQGSIQDPANQDFKDEVYGLFRMLSSGPVITFSSAILPESDRFRVVKVSVGANQDPELELFDLRSLTVAQISELFREVGLIVEADPQELGTLVLLPNPGESTKECYARARSVFEHLIYSQEADPVSLEGGTLPQWRKCRPSELVDWESEADSSLETTEKIFGDRLIALIASHLEVNIEANHTAWESAKQELMEFCKSFLSKISPVGPSIDTLHSAPIPKPTLEEPVPSRKIFNEQVERLHPRDPRAHFIYLNVVKEIMQNHFASEPNLDDSIRRVISELWYLSGDLLHKRLAS